MKQISISDHNKIEFASEVSKKNGLGIEIQGFYNLKYLANLDQAIERYKKEMEGVEIRSLHGFFIDLVPGSEDRLIQDASLQRFQQSYDLAKTFGCTDIVFHHGYNHLMNAHGGWTQRYYNFMEEFLGDKPMDMHFHIENVIDTEPDKLLKVVKKISAPNVDICLDIGHAHCHSDIPVLEWIKTFQDNIGHVHLHSNHGEEDEHLGLHKGTIPMEEVCEALEKYAPNANWILEVKPKYFESSVRWLQEHNYLS